MPNIAANVEVAITGAVHFAPAGSPLPTNANTALATAYLEAGFIDTTGVVRAHSTSTNEIQAWQYSAIVRTTTSKDTLTWKFTMLETNPVTEQIYYGAAPDAQGTVAGRSGIGIRGIWVVDTLDGVKQERLVMPDGQVTAWDDLSFISTGAVMYGVTITAYPDSAGNNDYRYKSTATDPVAAAAQIAA